MKLQNNFVALLLLATGISAQAQTLTPPDSATPPSPTVTPAPALYAVPVVQLPLPVAPPAAPKPSGIADIVRAKFPLAITYAELGVGWRELTYQGTIYFTKGDTALLNNTEYLVTYRFTERDTSELNGRDYVADATRQNVPYQADDRFELTMLRASNIVFSITEGQTNLRSFNATHNKPSLDPANFSDSFNQNLSLIFLRQIYSAMNAYSAAYLNVLPPMQTAFAAQKALLPYAENALIFTQPGTSRPFKANPNLSNRKRQHLYKKGSVVMFYEANPASDGLRAVLQINGGARRVDAKTWAKLSKLSGLDS